MSRSISHMAGPLCLLTILLIVAGGSSGLLTSSASELSPLNVSISSPEAGDSVRVVWLTTNDIVFNPSDERIYASVPSSAGSIGNSIAAVNPRNGDVGSSVFVGSEPTNLAIAGDGQTHF